MQGIFDKLYKESKEGKTFNKLIQLITLEQNIQLAYRNIKTNKGSNTKGTDGKDITHIKNMDSDRFIKLIQDKLSNYHPKSVKRVMIPKPNGKLRPLGIPCIEDRIIQQCILQILEPICEAKFHSHSYGFRPNRSTKHAISRCMGLINAGRLHYVVDIDIKGFFDNVNHSKLKKQLWNLGIQDKNLMCVIGKILKSEIDGEGIPMKGTPQGGIISPLLSNVVLNELDWWISSQWETFNTNYTYSNTHKYRAMKTSKLKEIFIVRYADDFKIFCRSYKVAQKIYSATKSWLKERLHLDISPEKSKITNLRKNYTEFLGFKLMAKPKRGRYVCQSRMSNNSVNKTLNNIRNQVKIMQKELTHQQVNRLNSIILGSHNYYNCATYVNLDFSRISFLVLKTMYNRLRAKMTNILYPTDTYKKFYGDYNCKPKSIQGITIYPIYGCKTKPPMNFKRDICNYTENGREMIHASLEGNYVGNVEYLLRNYSNSNSIEYNDNRISLMVGQRGLCYVTKTQLTPWNMKCHHKKPKHLGGTDEYKNLVWLNMDSYNLIHETKQEVINKYLDILKLDNKGLKKVNSLRRQVGNSVI